MKKSVLTLFALFIVLSVFAAPYDLLSTLHSSKGSFSKIPPKGNPPVIEFTKSFYIVPTLRDWSKYKEISAEFKNDSIETVYLYIRFISQPKEAKSGVWGYGWEIVLNPGEDFQKFSIPLAKMEINRQPVGWNKIDRFEICYGYGKKMPKDFKVSVRNFQLSDGTKSSAK